MHKVLKKLLVALGVVLVTGLAGAAVMVSAKKPDETKQVDTRPVVEVEQLAANDHQVLLSTYGEVQPLESTQLAAQVTGEVVSWNERFVAGGIVERGELLFTIEKDNYEAAVLQAEAELARAQAALIEEQAQQDVAKDEAARTPGVKRSALFLREPQVLSAKAAVKSAEAALKRAQRDLDNCEVRAPYDALVISRNVGQGQFVSVGSQVAELNNIETAEVIVPVAGFDSAFLPQRVAGTPATIIREGLNGFTRSAVIDRDLGVVDSATRMSNLVVRVNDPYAMHGQLPKLKFGSYVQVQFAGQTLKEIFRLPQELVNNQTVWVVNKDNLLQPRQVKVVREEDEFFLISGGLDADDRVVITLPEYPQEGMEVRIAGAVNSSENSPKTTDQL
ncbi:efflux RND transporter periplasmic adaptor subunit [Pseudoalteromonas ruthenica]|uniref:Membrane protein n=2 Tax=Pseudoalteromonas TaxID=53246 RepID=A0A0F4PQC9_9GAMM|nr:membrane protein [Pseudoalteromonas ruthenica]KJY99297.1 membrane protein [Pseudoalteromonas ruthenica]TMO86240.1 efflux RND transporter periplasmic adaptor subunit [Pseudoalteromonas ruthenica]TMO90977.1 efflux RND transporter periplasmic adaptor subunit [Pseudoalteromonas ruthenica]TMO98563.1 efflux RND transporter periplasmic adaptor subunit [Pseudoalteromonas ruthenica]